MRFLIVNADDFGYGNAINRGIERACRCGIVTSASLMVNTPGTGEALDIADRLPDLSLGLHVNFTNEAQRLVAFENPEVARTELRLQFHRFVELTGRLPTHIDAHQHVHRAPGCGDVFTELAVEYGLPLRERPPVIFKGGFYAQWEYGVSDPTKVSHESLARILRDEVTTGIYELAVHPGYSDSAVTFVYDEDREHELRTLTDPRSRELLARLSIQLISYHQLGDAVRRIAAHRATQSVGEWAAPNLDEGISGTAKTAEIEMGQ